MALITLAEYKTFAAIGDTGSDTRLTALLPQAQADIEKFCNRYFEDGATARTEYFDGGRGGKNIVWPRYLPIVSVTSLHDDPDRGYGDAYLVDTDDYVVYDRYVRLDGLTFSKGLKNIKLVYVGGYVPTGAGANVPNDLKETLCMYISWLTQRIGKEAMQSQSIAQLNVSTSYITEMPIEIKRRLGPYKRYAKAANR